MPTQNFKSAIQAEMFALPSGGTPGVRRRLTPQQQAMADRPSAIALRRSAETWRAPAQERMVKHREIRSGEWICRVYDSPYSAALLLVTADRAGQALSEEVHDLAEADRWIAECTKL